MCMLKCIWCTFIFYIIKTAIVSQCRDVAVKGDSDVARGEDLGARLPLDFPHYFIIRFGAPRAKASHIPRLHRHAHSVSFILSLLLAVVRNPEFNSGYVVRNRDNFCAYSAGSSRSRCHATRTALIADLPPCITQQCRRVVKKLQLGDSFPSHMRYFRPSLGTSQDRH